MIGIYFLIKDKKVVYIGQTKHFPSRLIGHNDKDYDTVRFITCEKNVLTRYESRLISYFKPVLNKKLPAPKGKRYILRVPMRIYNSLKKRAADNQRSLNGQIVYELDMK